MQHVRLRNQPSFVKGGADDVLADVAITKRTPKRKRDRDSTISNNSSQRALEARSGSQASESKESLRFERQDTSVQSTLRKYAAAGNLTSGVRTGAQATHRTVELNAHIKNNRSHSQFSEGKQSEQNSYVKISETADPTPDVRDFIRAPHAKNKSTLEEHIHTDNLDFPSAQGVDANLESISTQNANATTNIMAN